MTAGLPEDLSEVFNMLSENQSKFDAVDEEWIELLLTAKHLGLTVQDVRNFFDQNKHEQKQVSNL